MEGKKYVFWGMGPCNFAGIYHFSTNCCPRLKGSIWRQKESAPFYLDTRHQIPEDHYLDTAVWPHISHELRMFQTRTLKIKFNHKSECVTKKKNCVLINCIICTLQQILLLRLSDDQLRVVKMESACNIVGQLMGRHHLGEKS